MPVVVVHGGAAQVARKYKALKQEPLLEACRVGYRLMKDGKSAVDAVEAAVRTMENDSSFNAGYGSSLNANGDVECDALIMDGRNLKAGAVCCVSDVANPVSLARLVMEKTEHCCLSGDGARAFAAKQGVPLLEPGALVTDLARERLESYQGFQNAVSQDHDTVGAVAVDDDGNVACATSTGGITGKLPGRVGDSPCIGSGGWADNATVAVSTTGHGETLMRVCVAKHIASGVEHNLDVQRATEEGLRYMTEKVGGFGGAIAVDSKGNIGIYFTTQMSWAYIKNDDHIEYGLDLDEKRTAAI